MAVEKSWTVVRHSAGGGPINWFKSREKANEYAAGIAFRNPGTQYVILEIVGAVKYPLPNVAIEDV